MKKRSAVFELALFFLLICAGVALIIFQNPSGVTNDTPSLPGVVGSDIDVPADIADTNRRIVEQVEINEKNLQNVLKTLARPQSYRIEAQIIYYYGGDSAGTFYVKSWVRPDVSLTELYSQSGVSRALLKNTVLTDTRVYVWEAGVDTLYSGFAGDYSPDDLNHMPTYESIFSYPEENVISGGIDIDAGTILAETVHPASGYTEKWSIGIESGLLLRYQCYDDGTLVCAAELITWQAESIGDDVFLLPGGHMPE